MAEPLTLRFTIDGRTTPTAAQVCEKMGATILGATRSGDVYEVTFEPARDDEADSIFLMICEIGHHFPGAVLSEYPA